MQQEKSISTSIVQKQQQQLEQQNLIVQQRQPSHHQLQIKHKKNPPNDREEVQNTGVNPLQEEWQTHKNKKFKEIVHNNIRKQQPVYIAKRPNV